MQLVKLCKIEHPMNQMTGKYNAGCLT